MQGLPQLNEKLDLLLKKYTALQAENKRLDKTIARQIKTIDSLNIKIAGLEQQLLVDSLNAMDVKDKTGVKKQLDQVIGEIDKILNTLND